MVTVDFGQCRNNESWQGHGSLLVVMATRKQREEQTQLSVSEQTWHTCQGGSIEEGYMGLVRVKKDETKGWIGLELDLVRRN